MRLLQTIRGSCIDRHVHTQPYAAIVLSGGYEEAGDNGRFEVNAGNVIFHDRFEAHLNRFPHGGAVVLNLVMPAGKCDPPYLATLPDPDLIARVAKKSPSVAAELVLSTALAEIRQISDWPDELAARLMSCPSLKISDWAEARGLRAWTISRGFRQVFGVPPEVFRARVRTQRALKSIQSTPTPLAIIATEAGFADQAHMTRSVKQLTGATPQAWRRLQMDSIRTR